MISVVCPFYNEQIILAKAIDRMVNNLQRLQEPWELVIVNDGSLDDSLKIAQEKAARDQRIKIVSYEKNQGRGYALEKGIEAAYGDFIITTEVDCSWGDNIVADLAAALHKDKTLDIVIASTNLKGGGYVNVPFARVLLSRMANFFLGLTLSQKITMFTGMTRGYRAASIKRLPISEKGKEFHLDVLAKAIAFGFKIGEVPAVISWQDDKLARAGAPKRKSSSKIPKIIRSHILFGLSGRPYRYLLVSGMVTSLLAVVFLSWGVMNFLNGKVSVYLLMLAFSCFILTVLLGGVGVLALQQSAILRELWITRQELKEVRKH
jgi:dolichol-phosphate mannosyltransferase